MSIRAGLGLVFCCAMSSVSLGRAPTPAPTPTLAAAPPATHPAKSSPYRRMKLSERAREFYPAVWGIDRLRVNSTSSGNLIRFSYRVLEPKLAKALGDHESTPYLYAPRSHAMLQVPTMEKIGQLRWALPPTALSSQQPRLPPTLRLPLTPRRRSASIRSSNAMSRRAADLPLGGPPRH
jgi:hypothetical protein